MKLTEDYKNIVKLRFDEPDKMNHAFYESLYSGILNPEDFDMGTFENFHLSSILHYLKKSHTEYLTIWFPKLEGLVNDIQKEIGLNEVTLTLKSFIVNYYNELTNHINFEEKVLYNFVEKLLKGVYVEKEKVFVLNHFLETHNHDVSDDLGTIQKVLVNKDSEILDNKNVSLLFEQFNIVQNDLTLHGIIEDELLISKIHQYIEEEL